MTVVCGSAVVGGDGLLLNYLVVQIAQFWYNIWLALFQIYSLEKKYFQSEKR